VVRLVSDTFKPVDASLDRFAGAIEELASAFSARRLPPQDAVKAADRVQQPAVLLTGLVVELSFAFVRRCLALVGGGLPAVRRSLAFIGQPVPIIGPSIPLISASVSLVSRFACAGHSLLPRAGAAPTTEADQSHAGL
jgi:hypothetical protein